MSAWRWLNNLRWYGRWPLKLAILLVGTGVVLFPKVWMIPTTVQRYRDMDSTLDPGHPQLRELEDHIRAEMLPEAPPEAALPAVEKVVCERIPYGWDWEVWGVAEYLPTVAEVFERGREDCDGRAVVAASLLRRLGYDAWLVSDLLHVWVATPQGETMSPTGGQKTLVATETGTQTVLGWGVARNAMRSLSYGVAVFPLGRELILLALIGVLTMHPRSSGWRRVVGCLLLWIALDTMRAAGRAAAMDGQPRDTATLALAVAIAVAGWLVLAIRRGAQRGRSAATAPE